MNKNKMRVFAGLVAMLLALVTLSGVDAQTAGTPAQATLAIQNNSGISGRADLTDNGNNTTTVKVTVSGQPAGNVAPAHIHVGTCDTLGAIKYPLTNIENNTSTTIVNASLTTITAEAVAINLHKSAAEVAVYTACGNIVRSVSVSAPAAGNGGSVQAESNLWTQFLLGGFALVALASGLVLYSRSRKTR